MNKATGRVVELKAVVRAAMHGETSNLALALKAANATDAYPYGEIITGTRRGLYFGLNLEQNQKPTTHWKSTCMEK